MSHNIKEKKTRVFEERSCSVVDNKFTAESDFRRIFQDLSNTLLLFQYNKPFCKT